MWALARVGQSAQFLNQLYELDHEGAPKMELHGILFTDENHKKVVIGHISRNEYRISRDNDGNPQSIENGGTCNPKSNQVNVKFPGEARGCFMAGMRKLANGKYKGVKGTPFIYSGRTVVRLKRYKAEIQKELQRVIGLDNCWKKFKNGYKDKYPDTWYEEVCKVVNKSYCNVCDIMDHVVNEGKQNL